MVWNLELAFDVEPTYMYKSLFASWFVFIDNKPARQMI